MSDIIEMLASKYPLTFKDMEIRTFSFLPEGWIGLVDRACSKIENILIECYKTHPPDEHGIGSFRIEQIKEKYGSLRFYYTFYTKNDKAYEQVCYIVDKAEEDSHKICEVTGKPGEVCVAGFWYKTLSEEIRQKPEYKDYVPFTKDMII